MLSARENQRLTRVGPGTPMGELLRRYWYPVAALSELEESPTKAITILGESLVLFRDKQARLGLVGAACAHRRVSLVYGIPEFEGLRCPYHGWLYDADGRCLDQPGEAPDSTFKDRIRIPAYQVQALGGLVFAYLGPNPAPLLPRWDLLVQENVIRKIGAAVIPCNWLQIMENSVDPVHAEWLHGHYYTYVLERKGAPVPEQVVKVRRKHKKIRFDLFDYGILKRRIQEGQTEDDDDWRIGHPLVFPNILRVGGGGQHSFQFRVPMDDTHTWHVWYTCYTPDPDVPAPHQETVPFFHVPLVDQQGRFITDTVNGQDMTVWIHQGPVLDRSQEKLAGSDEGIILFRRLLHQELEKVAEKADPMNVFRDPAKNTIIRLPQETNKQNTGKDGLKGLADYFRYATRADGPSLE